ncbi:MAG: hypothetical protein U1E49_21715 [Hyphomicrobiaceae bacterium]
MIGRWLGVLLALWIGSYAAYRTLGQEVWAVDGKTYVILPAGAGVRSVRPTYLARCGWRGRIWSEI